MSESLLPFILFALVSSISPGLILDTRANRMTVSYTHLTLPTNREV